MLQIRKSIASDADYIWEILKAIISSGDSFAYSPSSSKDEMLSYWLSENKNTYTALLENKVVGTFFIQDNQPGLGSHIANAAYATSPKVYGKGIGKQMGLFSLDEARKLGYKAIQFNIVVKTNLRAVKLWQDIGFSIIGEIPEAFQHKTLGMVNAYVMYQKL
ncbi:MAG: GNAT family N-acetyltransferase [Bacteroidetes bacterium GWA2_30_7]|nr:MAG: GNAT family N-acetyltransferase [Bacteroidetes bacterium GWA2_30_7]